MSLLRRLKPELANLKSAISDFRFEIETLRLETSNLRFAPEAWRRLRTMLKEVASGLAWFLRQVSGDAAYENYVHAAARSRGASPGALEGGYGAVLSREQFYLDALRRRYTGVSRCC